MELFLQYILGASKFVLIVLSLAIIVRCIRSMLSERYEPEVWAYIRAGGELLPINHWENIIGRSPGADIRIARGGYRSGARGLDPERPGRMDHIRRVLPGRRLGQLA